MVAVHWREGDRTELLALLTALLCYRISNKQWLSWRFSFWVWFEPEFWLFKGIVHIYAVKNPSFQSKLSYGPKNLWEYASHWYFPISFKKFCLDLLWGSGSEISEIHGFGASRKFLIQDIGKVKTEMIRKPVINYFYVWTRSREQFRGFSGAIEASGATIFMRCQPPKFLIRAIPASDIL